MIAINRRYLKLLLTLGIVSLIFSSILLSLQYEKSSRFQFLEDNLFLLETLNATACTLPLLVPFPDDIQKLIKLPNKMNCPFKANGRYEAAFINVPGSRLIKKVVDDDLGDCCYKPYLPNQNRFTYSCVAIKSPVILIPQDIDFIHIECSGNDTSYHDVFALVSPKMDLENDLRQMTEKENLEKMSVMVLGLDATSQMNFVRMLPKTRNFLLKNLSAIEMKGYTKVGENTFPNVVPMLTGCKVEDGNIVCDENDFGDKCCAYLWEKFSQNGYWTGYAEDDVSIGIFSDHPQVFKNSTIDFVLLKFMEHVHRFHSHENHYCYGTRLSFKMLLDNQLNFAATFADDHFFQFTWATKLMHDNFAYLSLGDEPLLEYLVSLKEGGYLNKTALILLGDHGSRLDSIRATPQGKIEDRMPAFYMVLPDWFKTEYSQAYSNLLRNQNLIFGAFDIHKTLLQFMELKQLRTVSSTVDPTTKSISKKLQLEPKSLFETIPEERTCFQAGIKLHWCVCARRDWSVVQKSSIMTEAIKFSIDYMNEYVKSTGFCANLSLKNILDTFYLDLGQDKSKLVIIRVAFTTKPGRGMFEATVVKDIENSQLYMSEEVVRTNAYESDNSHCVSKPYKKYCYCL